MKKSQVESLYRVDEDESLLQIKPEDRRKLFSASVKALGHKTLDEEERIGAGRREAEMKRLNKKR